MTMHITVNLPFNFWLVSYREWLIAYGQRPLSGGYVEKSQASCIQKEKEVQLQWQISNPQKCFYSKMMFLEQRIQ